MLVTELDLQERPTYRQPGTIREDQEAAAQRKPAKGGGASERWTRPRLERVRPNELSEFLLLHVDVHVLQNKATGLVSCTFRHHRHRF